MSSRNLVLSMFFLISAACASTKAQQVKLAQKAATPVSSPGQPKPKGKLECHMERPTGSNLAERVCSYEGDESDVDFAAQHGREEITGPRASQGRGAN